MNSTNKQKWIAWISFLGVPVGIIMMQFQGLGGWGFLVTVVSLVLVIIFKKHLEGEKAVVPEVKKEDGPKLGIGGWIGSIAFVIFAIWGVSALTSAIFFGDKKEQVAEVPQSYDDAEAYLYAKGAIETILKAPSTAKFEWMGDVTRYNDNVIKVESHVDAENSFGAMLRSPWTVIFRDNEGRPEMLQVVLDGNEYFRSPEL